MTKPKQLSEPAPRQFRITHNLSPGAQLVLRPDAVKDLVRLFGEQVLARVGGRRDDLG